MRDMIHTDRASNIFLEETKNCLHEKSNATSKKKSNHPVDNRQVEKLNDTLWKAIQVTLHTRKMMPSYWENIVSDSLH